MWHVIYLRYRKIYLNEHIKTKQEILHQYQISFSYPAIKLAYVLSFKVGKNLFDFTLLPNSFITISRIVKFNEENTKKKFSILSITWHLSGVIYRNY